MLLHIWIIIKVIYPSVLLGVALLLHAEHLRKENDMGWLLNALVLWVVIIVANLLHANFHVFGNGFLNLFFWALVLSLFVGVGIGNRLTVNRV